MKAFDAKQEAIGIVQALEKKRGLLEKARMEEYEMQKGFKKIEREIADVGRDKMMEFALDPAMQDMKDPRTGKANKEWTQFVMDKKLSEDEEYVEIMARYYQYQEALAEATNKALTIAEQVGILKGESALLAAMLRYLSEESDA